MVNSNDQNLDLQIPLYVKGDKYMQGDLIRYKNGTVAQIQSNGSHKFIKGFNSLSKKEKKKLMNKDVNLKKYNTRSKKKPLTIQSYVKGKKYAPGTMVKYTNGTVAKIKVNGGHVFVKGYSLTDEQKKKRINVLSKSKGPGSRKMSPRTAMKVFNQYYASKQYKTDAARKGAMTRNLCYKSKVVVDNRRFLRNPGSKSFKGVTDGSKCPKGYTVTKYKRREPTLKQLQALKKGRENFSD